LSGIALDGNNLSGVDLSGQTLTDARFYQAALMGANFSQASLYNTYFYGANLTGADFTGADVRGAVLENVGFFGFTADQLYSTASYQAHDLTGIVLAQNQLTGWNFAGQNLTNADFSLSTFTGADFTGAEVRGANFHGGTTWGLTAAQLYSTASYQAHDLTGIGFFERDLTGWNFVGQNLTNANFSASGADITGAVVRGATIGNLTAAQLYSTASYQAHDLTEVALGGNNLSGWNFSGQNLAGANFFYAHLNGTDFTGAVVRGAQFQLATAFGFSAAQLYSTASYQAHDLTGINLSYNQYMAGWNFAGQNLTNANFYGTSVTGSDFTGAEVKGASFGRDSSFSGGLTLTQLYSTASYQAHDLTGVDLGFNELTGANLAGQNLTNVSFSGAWLTDANFTGAVVRGANFEFGTYRGFTAAQLYSTASYQAHDLAGIGLLGLNLAGWNFAGQNLSAADFRWADLTNANLHGANLANANFSGANVTGADFTVADARGTGLVLSGSGAITANMIQPYGQIKGLDLGFGELLVVRNYDAIPPAPPVPITVEQHLVMTTGGTLRMVFENESWGSTVSFQSGIPVALGGTLELAFADGVSLSSQIGRTFDVFDWTGVNPSGAFTVDSPYIWDLSNLYTTGSVTFLAAAGLPGDFNNDNVVDSADYVAWRKGFGTTYTQAANNVWRGNFGATLGAGGGSALPSAAPLSAAVPEPSAMVLLLLTAAGMSLLRHSKGLLVSKLVRA
jgi:uncharacterized protein YjbI with pentapeptide repeats